MRRAFALAAVVMALAAAPAVAQSPGEPAPRDPEPLSAQAATLLQLAEVLGQSHALRQSCAGRDDQYWRTRMTRILDVDVKDQALAAHMAERFNAGFASAQSRYPRCDAGAKAAAAALAGKGRELSAALAE